MGKKKEVATRTIYLNEWLRAFNISQTAAADIAGCDQSYIANLAANRKKAPNTLYLLALSEKLGITVNDFFTPAPKATQIEPLAKLSSQARATVMERFRKKA